MIDLKHVKLHFILWVLNYINSYNDNNVNCTKEKN